MNVAELIGQLESAVNAARKAGADVEAAIKQLADIFGSVLPPTNAMTGAEPKASPLPEPKMLACPYCGKLFPEWIRPHRRNAPRFSEWFRVTRHVAMQRKLGRTDHGEKGSSIP